MPTAKQIAQDIIECFEKGNKLLICGNGGSSAEADHMVSEFLTHGIPAISLNNPATITAIANDDAFEWIFARQITILGREGDLLIGLSTSGKSKNILQAYKIARQMGIKAIDWPRKIKPKTDSDVARVQEDQLRLMHKVYLKVVSYFDIPDL